MIPFAVDAVCPDEGGVAGHPARLGGACDGGSCAGVAVALEMVVLRCGHVSELGCERSAERLAEDGERCLAKAVVPLVFA